MIKNTSNDNTNINRKNTSNSTNFSYNTNTQNNNQQQQQQQEFNESVNRSLDQTKDNINRSIEESRNQIPQYNNIVNSYQEQTLQAVKEITENFIESQKTIIRSIQSSWVHINKILTLQSMHGILLKQLPMHIADVLVILQTIQ